MCWPFAQPINYLTSTKIINGTFTYSYLLKQVVLLTQSVTIIENYHSLSDTDMTGNITPYLMSLWRVLRRPIGISSKWVTLTSKCCSHLTLSSHKSRPVSHPHIMVTFADKFILSNELRLSSFRSSSGFVLSCKKLTGLCVICAPYLCLICKYMYWI